MPYLPLLILLFPVCLLGFMLWLARVESGLDGHSHDEQEIEQFLRSASSDELNTLVREGTGSALHRFRARLRRR